MAVKISIIGAGSAVFSPNIIKDLCLTPTLEDSTVCLMDINEQRLEAAYTLCSRFAGEVGSKLRIEKTADRKECLLGADFVINTALAASHDRLREGWQIAQKNGYRFGGSLHVYHDEAFWVNFYQLQLMESILADVLAVCPKAWFVLVANPVLAGVTFLKRKYPEANIVGMCHGYGGIYGLAQAMGLEREHITYEIPGVNHFVWLTDFRYKGEDAYPMLDRWIEEKSAAYWETCAPSSGEGPKAVDLYRRFGVFPIGDTCTPGGGCWGYWYHTDDETEKKWQEEPDQWYSNYFRYGLAQVEKIRNAAQDLSVRVSDVFPAKQSDEPMIPLIEALACGIERVVIVNILNDGGFVPGVPADFEVEVPAVVNSQGIHGMHTKALPKPVLAWLLRDRVASVETELEAYEKGSYDALLSLILMDPCTKTESQARNLIQEIFDLPYHSQMRNHYR